MNRNEGQWQQQEFSVPVVRGLGQSLDSSKGVGVHWSTDSNIAKGLAGMHRTRDEYEYQPTTTTLVHGEMPFSSVEGDKGVRRKLGVLGVDNPKEDIEKEVTAKKGSTVKVNKLVTIKESPMFDKSTGRKLPVKSRARTRTFNPPREMKA